MSEVSGMEFMGAVVEMQQHYLLHAMLDQIVAISDGHAAAMEKAKASSVPVDMRDHLLSVNQAVADVNNTLINFGGVQHYFEDGETRHHVTFLLWGGPLNNSEPGKQSWTVVSPGGGTASIEIDSSVIDEMRATAEPALPPTVTAFSFGAWPGFGTLADRAKHGRRPSSQDIIERGVAQHLPFPPTRQQ